jgi:hypothetical protein
MQFSTYVATGVSLVSLGGNGVNSTGVSPTLENHGQIVGLIGVNLHQTALTLINGPEGIISGFPNASASYAVDIAAPSGSGVINYGQISMPGALGAAFHASTSTSLRNFGSITSGTQGIFFDSASSADNYAVYNYGNIVGNTTVGAYNGSTTVARETVVNHGAIQGAMFFGSGSNDSFVNGREGVVSGGNINFGSGSGAILANYGGVGTIAFGNGNNGQVLNFGTISGNLTLGSGNNDRVLNEGRIVGSVTLGSGSGTVFDSTVGQVLGTITAGSGGATIIGGVNGGTLNGSTGDDVLIANQTFEAASTYHAMVTLNGNGGTNALYGGGGINTFMSGNATYNQIWGGASQTAGYEGYTNNTLSYANAGAGVYVDLLNGHNAYVGTTAGQGWTGAGRFEDSISNVPNVVGTAYSDVIQAGNSNGRITGGVGADALYAGGGQDFFVYSSSADSNLNTGYDTIVGFNIAVDKIDLTAFRTDGTHLAISTSGTSNTVYWEVTPGVFNAATDLALVVNTTTPGGLTAANFIF